MVSQVWMSTDCSRPGWRWVLSIPRSAIMRKGLLGSSACAPSATLAACQKPLLWRAWRSTRFCSSHLLTMTHQLARLITTKISKVILAIQSPWAQSAARP